MTQANTHPGVPLALRVGGAFAALALVLALLSVVHVFQEGWAHPFSWTWGNLLLCAAAACVGAFATTNRQAAVRPVHIIGLIAAIVLIVLSRVLPSAPLATVEQYWPALYAGAALLCALVLRRSVMR